MWTEVRQNSSSPHERHYVRDIGALATGAPITRYWLVYLSPPSPSALFGLSVSLLQCSSCTLQDDSMHCLLPLFWMIFIIVLPCNAEDPQSNGSGLPIAPLTVPANRTSSVQYRMIASSFTKHHIAPCTTSKTPAHIYSDVTAAPPYNYPNATGTASNPLPNPTDSSAVCAGPNGEKGLLRKRMISIYANSGSPQPSGRATFVVECSIEAHVQPEASAIFPPPKAGEFHLTDTNLLQQQDATEGSQLGAASTSTSTVTTPSAQHLGDAMEMALSTAKRSSARSTSARTFAAAFDANDLTDMQMSRLHAVLQPTQTEMPNKSAQSLPLLSSGSEPPSSSSVAPPQSSKWDGVYISTPSLAPLQVSNTDALPNAALGGAYPTGKPDGTEIAKQSNALNVPEGMNKATSASGGSPAPPEQGRTTQHGPESSNVSPSKVDSTPKASAVASGASGPVVLDSGTSLGVAPGSPISVSTGFSSKPGSLPVSESASSNVGSDPTPRPGSNDGGSAPQVSFPLSNPSPSRTGSGSSGVGIIAIRSQSYTARETGSFVVVGPQTIPQGAPAVTIGSTPPSVGGDGVLVAGSHTLGPNQATGQTNDIITIASTPYSILPTDSGFMIIGSNTISSGGPAIKIASTPVSLGTNGLLVAGSHTLALGVQTTSSPNSVPNAILSQGGPVPGPSTGGLILNNSSSSNTTGAKPFHAGGVRVGDTVGRWSWMIGAGTVIAVVTCGIL